MCAFLPASCLHKLHCAFTFPHLNYGVEIYANCSNETLDKLNKLNNKLVSIILDLNYTTPNIEIHKTSMYLFFIFYLFIYFTFNTCIVQWLSAQCEKGVRGPKALIGPRTHKHLYIANAKKNINKGTDTLAK